MSHFPFAQNLFWDANIEGIELQKHKRYIIERVLTRGRIEDFRKLLTLYSNDEIKTELRKSKDLDSKTRHFSSWYFQIPEVELHASSFYH